MRNFKFILLALSYLFFSCSKENIVEKESKFNENEKNSQYVITEKEALDVVAVISKTSDSYTKRKKVSNEAKVTTFSSEKGNPFFYSIKKDGVLYVISADKRFQLVQGYSENLGDEEAIPDSMLYFLKSNLEVMEKISDNNFDLMDKKELEANIGFFDAFKKEKDNFEGFENIKSVINDDKQSTPSNLTARGMPNLDGNWVRYGPFLKSRGIEWNQSSAKLRAKYPNYANGPFLGCVTTAVGQVLKYHENRVKSVLGHENYPFKGSVNQTNYDDVLFDISEAVTVSTYSNGERGAHIGKGRKNAKDFINSKVKGVRAWDFVDKLSFNSREWYAFLSLRRGQPSVVGGNGHAWVVDGYIKTRVQKRWWWSDRYDEFYYMNWGWGGSHNGWFKRYNYRGFNNVKYPMNSILRIN